MLGIKKADDQMRVNIYIQKNIPYRTLNGFTGLVALLAVFLFCEVFCYENIWLSDYKLTEEGFNYGR